MSTNERTTIFIAKKTREQLRSLGRKGETYDAILVRLINEINRQEIITQQYKRLEEKDRFIPLEGI